MKCNHEEKNIILRKFPPFKLFTNPVREDLMPENSISFACKNCDALLLEGKWKGDDGLQ